MGRWRWAMGCASIAMVAGLAWFAGLYEGKPPLSAEVRQETLHSTVLGEQREYLVHLPDSYARQPGRRYPAVYVLDGSSQDLHTAASAALLARVGATEETIVVGVPNVSGSGRQRDYTPPGMRQDTDPGNPAMGEADRFLAFIERELVPAVERAYRTSSTRTLAGNSRGGLFVVHAFTAKPRLFDAYVANSPALWRDDAAMVARLRSFLREHGTLRGQLFLSLGSEENDKMRRAFEGAVGVLRTHAPAGLRWRAFVAAGAGHQDNAEKATPVALQWLHGAGSRP